MGVHPAVKASNKQGIIKMELMKEINTLANDYTPPEPQVQEDIRTERMLKSMTPPTKDKREDKPKASKPAGISIKNLFHSKK